MSEYVVELYDLYWDSVAGIWTIDNEKCLKLPANSIEKKVKALWRMYQRQFSKVKFRDKWYYSWVITGRITRYRRDKLEWFASREQKYVLRIDRMKTPHPTDTAWNTAQTGADGTYLVNFSYEENRASEGSASDDAVVVVIESASFQDTAPGDYVNYKLELRRVIGTGGT